jgi:hypothetical protein
MVSAKGNLKGLDALRTLEALSSAELKSCRGLVEQAALADINAYFNGANLGQLNPKTFYMLENLFNIRDKQNHSKQ